MSLQAYVDRIPNNMVFAWPTHAGGSERIHGDSKSLTKLKGHHYCTYTFLGHDGCYYLRVHLETNRRKTINPPELTITYDVPPDDATALADLRRDAGEQ